MQRLSRSTLGTRWWCPALAPAPRRRRRLAATTTTSALPTQQLSRLPLYGQPWSTIGLASYSKTNTTAHTGRRIHQTISATTAAAEEEQKEGIWSAMIIPYSSHRDGSIYKNMRLWKSDYLGLDPTDRDETPVEPMRFSAPTADCRHPEPDDDCTYHDPYEMMQVFSLELARAPPPLNADHGGLVQLYGYIAARDDVDMKLNYVFRRSRDDPIAVPVPVRQGSRSPSPIEMTGPKRAIVFNCDVLFEFDMRIKNGDDEEDDVQLIDGMTEFFDRNMTGKPTTVRIKGDAGGAVDMSLSEVYGFEATVEVAILEVGDDASFDFSLDCAVSTMRGEAPHKEFELFGGHVAQPCGLRRFVVAVSMETDMHLRLKAVKRSNDGGGVSNVVERCCSFEAKAHGCASNEVKLDGLASVSVKVTWSAVNII